LTLPLFNSLTDAALNAEIAMSKNKPPANADDKNQSRAFIEKARELGCDESSAAADELLGRLAKMPPNPKKRKIRKPGQ
jgi:hypothetical protein